MCVSNQKEIVNVYSNNKNIYSATIELCYTCNWDCKYCYLENHEEVGLSTGEIENLLVQLRALGCFDLTFTGGEIFTRKDAYEIIKSARKMGFEVTIMTNLSLMNYELLDKVKAIGVDRIECSLFSLNPLIHDEFVGKEGAFGKVYYNLFYCKKIGIDVMIGYHPLIINKNELEHFVKFAKKYELSTKYDCRVLPRMNRDSSSLKYGLSDEELVEALKIIDAEMGVEYIEKEDEYICESTHTNIVITPKGDVRLCYLLDDAIGNIKEDSLDTILNSYANKAKISQIRDCRWTDLTKECRECENKKYCIRCPGIALLEGKRFLESSPLNCRFAMARRKVEENSEKNIG